MKYLLSLLLFITSINSSFSQGVVTPIDATTLSEFPASASEGDYYIRTDAPVGLIYLGLQNGVYHPIFSQGLYEILTINNSANAHTITNLINPINPQDIATKLYADNQGSVNIYVADGVLTSPRTLTGAGKLLTYGNINNYSNQTVNYELLATSTTNFTTGIDSKNILNSDTVISENLFVRDSYKDSDGNPGTAGQYLSSTISGTKWLTVSSLPFKTINISSTKSPTPVGNNNTAIQNWEPAKTEVASLSVTITEESIITIYYNFTFYIRDNDQEGDRINYITITKPDASILDYIALSRNTPLTSSITGKTNYTGTNYGTKKIILTDLGDYVIQLNTSGDMKVSTGWNYFDITKSKHIYVYTGWDFSVVVTPKNI